MRAEQPGTPVFRPTLLVVDDEPLVADFVTEILEPEGFNIIAADSADAALSLLEKEDANIDILLTDIRMPGSMDGAQLANLVWQRWADMPIIVMSGYETPSTASIKCKVRFLPKPWSIGQLIDAVNGVAYSVTPSA